MILVVGIYLSWVPSLFVPLLLQKYEENARSCGTTPLFMPEIQAPAQPNLIHDPCSWGLLFLGANPFCATFAAKPCREGAVYLKNAPRYAKTRDAGIISRTALSK
jgi:hypothetical protein